MPNKGNREMRITDEDLAIIKGAFADNEPLLKVLRKVLLPEITPDAPLGQIIDLWMTVDIDSQTPEQAYINIKARNLVIAHVENNLRQLSNLAGTKAETVEQTKARIMQNSSK